MCRSAAPGSAGHCWSSLPADLCELSHRPRGRRRGMGCGKERRTRGPGSPPGSTPWAEVLGTSSLHLLLGTHSQSRAPSPPDA